MADQKPPTIIDMFVYTIMALFIVSLIVSAFKVSADPAHWLAGSIFSIFGFAGVIFAVFLRIISVLESHQTVSITLLLVGALIVGCGIVVKAVMKDEGLSDDVGRVGVFIMGVGAGFYGGFGAALRNTSGTVQGNPGNVQNSAGTV